MNYFGVEMPGKFSEFGSNLIQGLINGVSSMFPKLTSSISGVAESVVGTFKSLLGIHSPSRVFAGLGGFTMEGLEQGLQQGQSGPLGAVKSLGQQLTEAGVGSIKLTSDLETNLPTGKKGPFDALASIGKELPNARAGAAGLTSGLGHGLPTGKKGPFDALADIGKGSRPSMPGRSEPRLIGPSPWTIGRRCPPHRQQGRQAPKHRPPSSSVSMPHRMDEQQLARLVATHVERIQQKTKVRGRSALSDRE